MSKIWCVTLRRKYELGSESSRDIDVDAQNPSDAIKQALRIQRGRVRRYEENPGYRYATSVELVRTTDH